MSEEDKNNWEKLIHLPNEYDPDPELAKRAIASIKAQEEEKKSRKTVSPWVGIAATACVCAVGVAIVLPICLSPKTSEIIYYDTTKISYVDVSDISEFSAINNYNICYFDEETLNTQCAVISENGTNAFILQSGFYISSSGFDEINLKVVLLSNAEFSFYGDFSTLTEYIEINNITITYFAYKDISNNLYKAKFTYENVPYYLEITTKDEGTEVLEKYIDLLIS